LSNLKKIVLEQPLVKIIKRWLSK